MTPYPLAWPTSIPRYATREGGQFKTTLFRAMENVKDSLRRFGLDSGKPVSDLVISSNVTLGSENPKDPGVAIWFSWEGKSLCIPVDRYSKVEANLQAIHHIIEARRTELRHGTLALVRATFTGFLALPPGGQLNWRAVLGFEYGQKVDADMIDGNYRRLAKKVHPDGGGSHNAMAALNVARDQALKEVETEARHTR